MKIQDSYLYEKSDYKLSLRKLWGKGIKDVTGYICSEFSDPVFKICDIVFEDGTQTSVGGEHDLPFVEDYDEVIAEISQKIADEDE